MRLSDIKGERALEVLADIIDPITEIMSDPEVASMFRSGNKMGAAQSILRLHGKSVLSVMATLDEEDPKTYAPSLIDIPMKLIDLFNDPAFEAFFSSQGQNQGETYSGSATGTIEGTEEE